MNKGVLHTVFEQLAAERPDQPAVRTAAGEVSYRELNETANRAAGALRRAGLQPGGVVALFLAPGAGYVAAMLAVMKAGGVFVALDPAAPVLRQRKLLATVAPSLVVIDRERVAAWDAVGSDLPRLDIDDPGPAPAVDSAVTISPDDPCYIVFTSGSTGEPKAILGTHKGLSHFIHWELEEFALESDVRVSQLAPPTFDVSLRDLFVPLTAGGTVCIPSGDTRGGIDRLLDWLDAEAISLVHCVPTLFRALLQELARRPEPSALLTRLRYVLLAGEPLYGTDVQRWRSLMGTGTELVNVYGPSETTLAKAFYRIPEGDLDAARMVPVGKPLPNTALLIVKDGELCDPGEIGEVYISTPFMSRGYVGDPAMTAERFVANPIASAGGERAYRTGDFGRYRPDYTVELLGRQDTQVKVRGVRIELSEVENVLLQHPGIEQAVVVAHPANGHEVVLCGYYTGAAAIADDRLRDHLGQWLPASMHPAHLVHMASLPLNLHGKVMRRALPRPADLLYEQRPYEAAANEVERDVARLFDEILQIGKVSAGHSFVEMGGDSLGAIRLLPRLNEHFGVEVSFPELFPRGTVRQLAAAIAARRTEAPRWQRE
ncbi:MAG: amino acid adenylation domain-containing protein [Vicinamibacterales bacterium]